MEGNSSQPAVLSDPVDPSEAPHGPAFQRLAEAVIAVARRPSRAMFATWMRVVAPGWIVPMLGVALGIGILNGVINAVVETFLREPGPHAVFYHFGTPSLAHRMIYALVTNPLFGLIIV